MNEDETEMYGIYRVESIVNYYVIIPLMNKMIDVCKHILIYVITHLFCLFSMKNDKKNTECTVSYTTNILDLSIHIEK